MPKTPKATQTNVNVDVDADLLKQVKAHLRTIIGGNPTKGATVRYAIAYTVGHTPQEAPAQSSSSVGVEAYIGRLTDEDMRYRGDAKR